MLTIHGLEQPAMAQAARCDGVCELSVETQATLRVRCCMLQPYSELDILVVLRGTK